jgi:uncharacterized protein YfiM (DUF2279 family)
VKKWLINIFCLIHFAAWAQTTAQMDSTKRRTWAPGKLLTGAVILAGYGGSFVWLNEAWYKNYPRSPFHTFNDGAEWLQVDKVGHAWTAYNTSRITTAMWRWAGMDHQKSVVVGTGISLAYMLSIEYLDGRSAQWGWSWPDAAADFLGAGLFAGQEFGWREQRVLLKFSSRPVTYHPNSLEQRANQLFGTSLPERILKDYNAQKYWLSFNLRSLFGIKGPKWLNLAIGYGAEGMFGGYENIARDKTGMIIFDRRDIKRYRQWYLAPDIDLSRIKTKSRFLHTVLSTFNIKVPAPTLEFSNGKVRFKPLDL